MNIVVTPAAEIFMRRMVRFSNIAGAGFRLIVSPGGCAGFATEFSIEATPQPGEEALDINGLKVFLPLETRALLEDATVDFRDGAMASGLAIVNPNVSDCGCGSSGAGRGGRHATISVSSIGRKS